MRTDVDDSSSLSLQHPRQEHVRHLSGVDRREGGRERGKEDRVLKGTVTCSRGTEILEEGRNMYNLQLL